MGEILDFIGEPESAVSWLERAMRLNPYHPDGYHHDRGRALYDAGGLAEALASLRRIAAPLLMLAAASAGSGDTAAAARHLAAAQELRPGLDPGGFARGLPYRDPAAGERLAAALASIDGAAT